MVGRSAQRDLSTELAHVAAIRSSRSATCRGREPSPTSASRSAPAKSSACSASSAAAAPRSPSAIFGATPATAGEILVDGKTVKIASPGDAIRRGMAMVTEDRKRDGLLLDASILDNGGLASVRALRARRRARSCAPGEAGLRGAGSADRQAAPRAWPRSPAVGRQPAEGRARQMAAGRGRPRASSSTSRRAASTSPPRSRSTG